LYGSTSTYRPDLTDDSSISYYAPTIFKSIGITGSSTSLLASGIYGIVKIITTAIFVAFGIERFGRKIPLLAGVALMSMFLWIIGAVFYTHPPIAGAATVSGASIGMAVLIYLFVIPYCWSVGPLPWVICSESEYCYPSPHVVSRHMTFGCECQ
jgi:MFS family permease